MIPSRRNHFPDRLLDDEEIEEGLRCIGAPVRNYSGKAIASISIAGPAFRITQDQIPVMARSVVEAANQLSTELGYQQSQLDRKAVEVKGRIKAAV